MFMFMCFHVTFQRICVCYITKDFRLYVLTFIAQYLDRWQRFGTAAGGCGWGEREA